MVGMVVGCRRGWKIHALILILKEMVRGFMLWNWGDVDEGWGSMVDLSDTIDD